QLLRTGAADFFGCAPGVEQLLQQLVHTCVIRHGRRLLCVTNPVADLSVPLPAARARRSSVAAPSWRRRQALRRPRPALIPECVPTRKLPARPPATGRWPATCDARSASAWSRCWAEPPCASHPAQPGSAADLGGGPGH